MCAWVKQPGNTWSNLAYLLVGVLVFRRSRRKKILHLTWIGVVAFITGLGSAFLHLSGTYIGGCTDYLGMFLGTGLLTAYNTRRWMRCSFTTMYIVFATTTVLFLLLLHVFPEENRYLYGLGMPCCFIELWLFYRDRKAIHYRCYLASGSLIALATLFWWLDVSRRLCDPDNHVLSGHALWHILTAAAFLPLYRYYTQFAELKSEYAPASVTSEIAEPRRQT